MPPLAEQYGAFAVDLQVTVRRTPPGLSRIPPFLQCSSGRAGTWMRPYVAGATALSRDGPRFSRDIDVFHDREESAAAAADADVTLLGDNGFENGFEAPWLRRGRAWMSRWRSEVEDAGQRRGYWPSSAEIMSAMISCQSHKSGSAPATALPPPRPAMSSQRPAGAELASFTASPSDEVRPPLPDWPGSRHPRRLARPRPPPERGA